MKTKLQNITENELKEKRLIYLADTPNSSTLSEDVGLENPEKVSMADSNQSLMEKVAQVYVIDDPEAFHEAFSLLNELDGVNLSLDEVVANGRIDNEIRIAVMQTLIERMTELTTDNTFNKINSFQGATLDENTDVTDSARGVLDDLSKAAKNYDGTDDEKPDSESQYYTNLANVVESMGLKKDQLMRTNELTGRVKTLEQARNLTSSRLGLLKSHIKHVEDLEASAKKNGTRVSKWGLKLKDTIFAGTVLGGGGFGALSLAKTLTVALGSTLAFTSFTGVASTAAGIAALGALGKKYFPGVLTFNNEHRERLNSIALQKKLLKKGKINLKNGDYLVDFRTTEPIEMGKGAIIDGREVTAEVETAPRGAIITGTVAENIEVNLPQVDINGKPVYATQENLEKLEASQQAKVNEVQKTLTAHNSDISAMKTSFDTNFKELEGKVSKAEGIMGSMSQQMALAKMRLDQNAEGAQEEYNNAEKAFKEAKEVLERAKEALKALKKVQRVFGLNEEYAKQPVPAGVLKAIYEETVNPEALKLMLDLQKQRDEKTKAAQETLGKMDRDQLKKLLLENIDESIADELKEFFDQINDLRGLSEQTVLQRHAFLRALKNKNKELYKYLMAMTQVPNGTRYSSLDPDKGLFKFLEEVFDAADKEIKEKEKKEAKAAKKAARKAKLVKAAAKRAKAIKKAAKKAKAAAGARRVPAASASPTTPVSISPSNPSEPDLKSLIGQVQENSQGISELLTHISALTGMVREVNEGSKGKAKAGAIAAATLGGTSSAPVASSSPAAPAPLTPPTPPPAPSGSGSTP